MVNFGKKTVLWLVIITVEVGVLLILISYLPNRWPSKMPTTASAPFVKQTNALPNYWPISLTVPSNNNSNLIYELRTNYTTKFDGYTVRLPRVTTIKTNSDRFRDRDFSIEKLNNTFRIIVLGDSVTFGFGVENNETYPKVLERQLNSLSNGINYEVLNFGVWGYGTVQEVEMLKVKGLKYRPDMVILQFHETDLVDVVGYSGKRNDLLQFLLEKYNVSNLSTASQETKIKIETELYRLVKSFVESQSFEEMWKYVQEPLDELQAVAEKGKIKVLITITSPSNRYESLQYEKLKLLTKNNGWHFLNVNIFFKYPIDGHPTAKGHEVLGDQIFNYLVRNDLIFPN